VGPEALAGGPIGKVIDGDIIDIVIDRRDLTGLVNLVAAGGRALDAEEARQLLAARPVHPELRAHPDLPDDTRLWAALQAASGGPWAGCVYDVDRIIEVLRAGLSALEPK
jgi:dihydroxyacid dehydratase/phosphogluconate dehydratase